jgi:peptidoglycan/LPS O-acetylase OafA/YrhL
MGVLFNHVVRETPGSKRIFLAWIAFEGVCQFILTSKSYTITALAFSVFLYMLQRTDQLGKTLNGPVLRYLGKTSYSLYLVHPALCWTILSIAKYRLNDTLSPTMSGILFFMCTTASLVTAHVFYILFEKPSLHLCSALKEGFHLPGFTVGKSRNCEVDY